jgi:hypothetical protein
LSDAAAERNRDARVAGLLYLLAIVVGVFALIYLPDKFIRAGDATATAHAIVANEFLFRVAIVSDIAVGTLWLFVVLALYRLLADVDRTQAAMMVVLGAFMQVPLYFVNAVNYAAALLFATGSPYLTAFTEGQRDGLAAVFLQLHYYELLASFTFAGLWLIPFGILVFKSRFLPRFLGVWLVLNGVVYVPTSILGFLAPQYADAYRAATSPVMLGEIAIMLWLLIVGARPLGRNAATD